MERQFENFQDKRLRPKILASEIGWAIVYMIPLGLKSLLQVDQWARRLCFKRLIKTKRSMVSSDSTLQRVLPQFMREPLLSTLSSLYQSICGFGLSRRVVSCHKRLRIGIIDGSGFGHMFASVAAVTGKGTFPLDAQAFATRGKELPASRKVLKRVTRTLGKSWCDILVGDGLYMTRQDFQLAKEVYGCDLLVKTSEETLDIIQDAKGLLFSNMDDIEVTQGVDTQRNLAYEVRALSGFTWQGLPSSLRVAWIREEKLKPSRGENPIEEFYLVTTREDLSAKEMREIAHSRWEIENNVFKRLNALVKSKAAHTKHIATLRTLLLLWFIGLCLLTLFILSSGKELWHNLYGKVRLTWKFILDELSLGLLRPLPQGLSP